MNACAMHIFEISGDNSNKQANANSCAEKIFEIPNDNSNERANVIFNKLKLNHCSDSERQSVYQICKKFPYQFYLESDNLASTDIIKH